LAVLFGFDEATTDWPRRAGLAPLWPYLALAALAALPARSWVAG
jgi:hypothetical protein